MEKSRYNIEHSRVKMKIIYILRKITSLLDYKYKFFLYLYVIFICLTFDSWLVVLKSYYVFYS